MLAWRKIVSTSDQFRGLLGAIRTMYPLLSLP